MSTFSVKGNDVDVEAVMSTIRKRVEEKRKGLYTEDEIREIVEMKLDAVLDASEFNSDFVSALRARDENWNYRFDAETIYASSRGGSGSVIRWVRKMLNPLLKLFFNPNPLISALSRQSDLNRYYALLLHNMATEMTKMNLELTNLKARLRATGIRVEFQSRREKTLEEMTTRETPAASTAGPGGESEKSGMRRRRGRRNWKRRRGSRTEGGSGGDRRSANPESSGGSRSEGGSS